MCPERRVLSAYLDGELEGSWSGRLEEHLGRCPSCSAALEELRALRALLVAEQEPSYVDAMVRVRNSMVSRLPVRVGRWRPVAIPLPLAVLAACVMLLLGGAVALTTLRPWEPSTVRFTASPTGIRQFEVTGSPDDIQKILALLNKDAEARTVVFDIPEGIRLAPFGEPELRPALQRATP